MNNQTLRLSRLELVVDNESDPQTEPPQKKAKLASSLFSDFHHLKATTVLPQTQQTSSNRK